MTTWVFLKDSESAWLDVGLFGKLLRLYCYDSSWGVISRLMPGCHESRDMARGGGGEGEEGNIVKYHELTNTETLTSGLRMYKFPHLHCVKNISGRVVFEEQCGENGRNSNNRSDQWRG